MAYLLFWEGRFFYLKKCFFGGLKILNSFCVPPPQKNPHLLDQLVGNEAMTVQHRMGGRYTSVPWTIDGDRFVGVNGQWLWVIDFGIHIFKDLVDTLGSQILRIWLTCWVQIFTIWLTCTYFFLIEEHKVMAMVAMMMTIKQRRQRSWWRWCCASRSTDHMFTCC